MKLVFFFPSLLLGPAIILALLTSGVPPMWLLLPALVLAGLVMVGIFFEHRIRHPDAWRRALLFIFGLAGSSWRMRCSSS